MTESHYFNDLWTVYFHDMDCTDWNISSYIKISDISRIEEFVIVYEKFKNLWKIGKWFIMREGINPNWEDPQNIEGGCYSIKCNKNDATESWFNLCSAVLGETFSINPEHTMNINGISISPKTETNILRIWLKDNNLTNKEYYNFNAPKYSVIFYKKHN